MGTGSIRILGRRWKVLLRKRMKNDGECEFDAATIRIRAGQAEFNTRDALLHEVMHAILHRQGREYIEEQEELYVNALATGLIGVFQDNPKFAAWLASPIKDNEA